MITGKGLKQLAALHKKGNKPLVAVEDKKAILFSNYFVFELPKDEVTEEASTKFAGTLSDEQRDWRAKYVHKTPGEVASISRESVVYGGEVLEVVKLSAGAVVRWMLPEFFDFFSDQLLKPGFRVHDGRRPDGKDSAITIWEGSEMVGVIAAWDKDEEVGDDPPPEEEDAGEE